MKTPEEEQRKLLEQLGQDTPFIAAALNHVKRRDKQGRKQDYHILTFKQDGKTRSVYVPEGMLKEVKLWTLSANTRGQHKCNTTDYPLLLLCVRRPWAMRQPPLCF